MYRISELAEQVGLSRSALLYYEKLGLIRGQRLGNGYRIYSDYDVQRLLLVRKLQAGGLTLKECKACLDAKVERQLLLNRLDQLDKEIAQKQKSRQLLSALLGDGGLKGWHESIEEIAPNAHFDWLIKQGFNEKEALRLKWLSKDMNEHDRYMADFLKVFEALDRWGPGSEIETIKALEKIPFYPKTILEIGCGRGIATTVLAKHSSAIITAVDNDAPALSRLTERAKEIGVGNRIMTCCASMTNLPFEAKSYDVIWSEGSAYVMGVANALKEWRCLLKENGVLVISDLVWRTSKPNTDALDFWKNEYPDMTTAEVRIEQAEAAGYKVLDSFSLSKDAWKAYTDPLRARVDVLKREMSESDVLHDLDRELDIYRKNSGDFGYQMFVFELRGTSNNLDFCSSSRRMSFENRSV